MSLHEMFATDAASETGGIDLNYGAATIRIARAGGSNRRFVNELAKRMRPHRRALENGTLDDAVAETIMAEVYADTVILGWSGVTDRGGKPLPYTRANVVALLQELPELFRDLQDQAGRAATFRQQQLEESAKNS